MSLNINNVILAGHLTRDPEMRSLAGEKVVVNFGLAINRRFKGADGEIKEDSTFVDCEAWGRTAELVGQYLAKGSAAYVEGRLKLDNWQDKEGKNRSRLKVVVENVQFIGPPKAKSGTSTGEAAGAAGAAGATEAGEPVAVGSQAKRISGRPATGHDEPPF
jgi:single-strand DNA-binding protein